MRVTYLAVAACLVSLAGTSAHAQSNTATQVTVPMSMRAHDLSIDATSHAKQLLMQPRAADTTASPAADTVGTPAVDPAKVDIAEHIIINLRFYDILAYGGEIGLLESPATASYSPEQKEKLRACFEASIQSARLTIIRKLAVASAGGYSVDQLNVILNLSKIRYMQDSILEGANPAWVADERTVTPEDLAMMNAHGDDAYTTSFLKSVSYDTVDADLGNALTGAYQAFVSSQGK